VSVRRFDPKTPEVMGIGKCAFGKRRRCLKDWTAWCRGCNLVYCVAHKKPAIHRCRRGKTMAKIVRRNKA